MSAAVVSSAKISLSRLSKENSHSNQCILCHDGGGNLYSCKRNFCGKVYHIECYDPTNSREPPDYWTCLMCFTKEEFGKMSNEPDKYGNMGERDFKLCFRLMLEMKGNWPISRTFEPSETLDSQHYRDLIHYPVAMDVIQQRLNRSKGENKYTNCTQFMQEVRRMFSNCRTFWSVNTSNSYSSGMYMRHADKLEAFFDEKIQEWEKFFSTYTEYRAPKKVSRPVDRNVRKQEEYVPSFLKYDTPDPEEIINEKPKKCLVCQKHGTDTSPTHRCSKCKRAYHADCYVPTLKKQPPRDWNCIMCVTVDDLSEQPNEPNREGGKLGKRDYLICSRLFLELHKVWPDCKTFAEMASLDFGLYRGTISHPIALDIIRKRMDRKYPLQYESVKEFLKDVRLMFRNCKTFWKDQPAGENFIRHADNLKAQLDKCLFLLEDLVDEKGETKVRKPKEEKKPTFKREESWDENNNKIRRSKIKEADSDDEKISKTRRSRVKEEDSEDEKPLKPRRSRLKQEDSEDERPMKPKSSKPKEEIDDDDDSTRARRPGPLSFKRNLSRKPVAKKEESDVDEEISLSTMKSSVSRTSNPKPPKEEPEPISRRPGPASFKAKFLPNSQKEQKKQKDTEILRDTIAEHAFETGSLEKTYNKDYKCNYCHAVYNKLSKIQDHTLSHFEDKLSVLLPNKKPHLCPTCETRSSDNDALMKHYAFDCESVNDIQESIRKNLMKN